MVLVRGQKREFTAEEVEYIVNNWGKESAHSMKKKFNCSWYAVCRVAEENGLDLPESNEWKAEEVQILKKLSRKYHYEIIAKKLKKSPNAVYLKARKLGITLIQDRRVWTKQEEQDLRELWGTMKIEKIAQQMKRTTFSLKVKAVKMGLGPMVRNNAELITVSDIVDLLNVSRDRIMTTWVNLGLKLEKKQLTDYTSYYYVIWEDLIKFLKDNQNEWDSRNVEMYMLGPESGWLAEKRKRDEVENPLWYRKWTDEELAKAEYLLLLGKDYSEIATTLNRTVGAVADTLRDNGHSYELARFWKGKEIKFLRENYEKITYSEIAEELDRSTKAVAYKAAELGYQRKTLELRENSNNNLEDNKQE